MHLTTRISSALHSPWLKAVGILFSTTVGAGVLGVPYVIARVGVVVGVVYIVGMGIFMAAIHLLIAEMVLRTRRHLQITGIVRRYVGPGGAWIMAFVFFALHMGAMVAYLIGEGQSIAALIGGYPVAWTLVFFIIGSLIIGKGIKTIARFDLLMGALTVVVICIVSLVSYACARVLPVGPENATSLLLPYGVLLFAFHGTSAIPEMEIITKADPGKLRRAVLLGSLLPIGLYLIFAIGVVLVTGRETTEVATVGLGKTIGPIMVVFGNLFAIIAMSSSFTTIGQAIRRSLQWDYGSPSAVALVVAVGLPLIIFVLGARQFVKVIGLVGALCGTIEIILILVAYWRMHKAASYEENSDFRRRFWRR